MWITHAQSSCRACSLTARFMERSKTEKDSPIPWWPRSPLTFTSRHLTVVRLDGAVESAVRLGVADVIADVVETGSTLRAAGLEVFGEPILRSQAVLVRRAGDQAPQGLAVMVRRVTGVLTARRYVMVDYDCPRTHLDAAVTVSPGLESPTIAPLADPDWVAVRVMVGVAGVNRVMDELYELGARAILVTSIHACRI